MKAIQNTIVEEMNALDDWMDKYDYIIAQGRDLRCADEAIRSDQYALAGCQSQVWIRAECRDGAMRYMADSDAQITRGLIALLLRIVNGQSPKRVAEADFSLSNEPDWIVTCRRPVATVWRRLSASSSATRGRRARDDQSGDIVADLQPDQWWSERRQTRRCQAIQVASASTASPGAHCRTSPKR